MFRIVVSLREKRSTTSQFENVAVGCDIEANNLELNSAEEIVGKTRQMFQMARSAVQSELLQAVPERALPHAGGYANGHQNGNGQQNGQNGNGHNGNGRSYGRPTPEPTPKQKLLLQRIARERNLSAETVGEIARQECGKSVPQLDRQGMSHLLEALMSEEARP